jgi:hypothetical protein
LPVFRACADAVKSGLLIRRESRSDKEFHFQNWFRDRLASTGLNSESAGRNTYPDFRMVKFTEGYEVKGLAYPGRWANYDANSQVPCGEHNGRQIFYVFGRYPTNPDGDTYPVLDLVLCHGDFLNATRDYLHKNKSVKGFGSYGDIMIRDRKMYVAPTPFGLTTGTAHTVTLILPADMPVEADFVKVGVLTRRETSELIKGYSFNLRTNDITPDTIPNPSAGTEHIFSAWRLSGMTDEAVLMRDTPIVNDPSDEDEQ